MPDLLINLLQDYWYEAVTTLLAAWAVPKFVVLKSVIKRLSEYIKEVQDSKADGTIGDAEYVKIGRKAVAVSDLLTRYAKGLFPNRSN